MISKDQHFKWVFTINTSEDSPDISLIYKLLQDFFKIDDQLTDCTMQCEVGTHTARPHIQGRLHFSKKRTKSSTLNYFKTIYLTSLLEPGNIVYKQTTVSPERDAQASIAYCQKPDTRLPNTEPYNKLVKVPQYTGSDISFIGNNLRPWQRCVMKLINDKPYDVRKIYWYIDQAGASRQVVFCKVSCL